MLKHGGCVASDGEYGSETGAKTVLRMRANEPHPESITRLRFLLAIVPNRAIHTGVLVIKEATFIIQHCCKPQPNVSKIEQPLEMQFHRRIDIRKSSHTAPVQYRGLHCSRHAAAVSLFRLVICLGFSERMEIVQNRQGQHGLRS